MFQNFKYSGIRRVAGGWELLLQLTFELTQGLDQSCTQAVWSSSSQNIYVTCWAKTVVSRISSRRWWKGWQHLGDEAIQHYQPRTYGKLPRTWYCSKTSRASS